MKHSRSSSPQARCSRFGTVHAATAADPAFDAELLSIQQAWAKVNYETPRAMRRPRHSRRWRSAPSRSRSSTRRAPRP